MFNFVTGELHPSIRILMLLVLTLALPWLEWVQLTVLALVFFSLLALSRQVASESFTSASITSSSITSSSVTPRPSAPKNSLHDQSALQVAWQMLKRLKWFWLALLILFGWVQPGEGVFGIDAWWAPSESGLLFGLIRGLALMVLVLGVVLLQYHTPREDLLAGLMWLGKPFKRVGWQVEKAALRLILVMEYAFSGRAELVTEYQNNTKKNSEASALSRWERIKIRLQTLAQQTVKVVKDTEQAIVDEPLSPWTLPVLTWPSFLHVLLLILWTACIWASIWFI